MLMYIIAQFFNRIKAQNTLGTRTGMAAAGCPSSAARPPPGVCVTFRRQLSLSLLPRAVGKLHGRKTQPYRCLGTSDSLPKKLKDDYLFFFFFLNAVCALKNILVFGQSFILI